MSKRVPTAATKADIVQKYTNLADSARNMLNILETNSAESGGPEVWANAVIASKSHLRSLLSTAPSSLKIAE